MSGRYRHYPLHWPLGASCLQLLKLCHALCCNSSITQGLEVDGLKAFSFTFSSRVQSSFVTLKYRQTLLNRQNINVHGLGYHVTASTYVHNYAIIAIKAYTAKSQLEAERRVQVRPILFLSQKVSSEMSAPSTPDPPSQPSTLSEVSRV